jgi:hypothetical protein
MSKRVTITALHNLIDNLTEGKELASTIKYAVHQYTKQVTPAQAELIITYEKYIQILGRELDELAMMASVHGWKSSRAEIGEAMREMIKMLKKEVGFDDSILYNQNTTQ